MLPPRRSVFTDGTALGNGGQLEFGNVATNGSIGAVPEVATLWRMVFLLGCTLIETTRQQLRAKARIS